VNEVGDLPIDPDSNQSVVGRVNSSWITSLTLMRRLRPFVHEGNPSLLLFNSSLTFSEVVHGAVENVQGA
jgi:hypothetical protein